MRLLPLLLLRLQWELLLLLLLRLDLLGQGCPLLGPGCPFLLALSLVPARPVPDVLLVSS